MAKSEKKSIELLTPTAKVVTAEDGKEIRVLIDAEENRMMGWIMAAKMRGLLADMMKKYSDMDETMTPKELADLATAVHKTEQFAAEAYKNSNGVVHPERQEKLVEESSVSFDVLAPKKEEQKPA